MYFKAGQTVIATSNYNDQITKGTEYTVMASDNGYVTVRSNDGWSGPYHADHFDHAAGFDSEASTFLVDDYVICIDVIGILGPVQNQKYRVRGVSPDKTEILIQIDGEYPRKAWFKARRFAPFYEDAQTLLRQHKYIQESQF